MEDEKIIDLYFERNENAVAETALKYGRMLRAIAYGILKITRTARNAKTIPIMLCGTRYRRKGRRIFLHF